MNTMRGYSETPRDLNQRVVILQNHLPSDPKPDELDSITQANFILTLTSRLGYCSTALNFSPTCLAELLFAIRNIDPFIIFNLVEDMRGDMSLLETCPRILEQNKLPFTGARAETMAITTNKLSAKLAFSKAKLPTPGWITGNTLVNTNNREAKFIVKPVAAEGSIGLHEEALKFAPNSESALAILSKLSDEEAESYFAEEYIDGREFNVSILSDENGLPSCLPVAEINFEDFYEGRPRVVGYKAKWDPESFEYQHTNRKFQFSSKDSTLIDSLKKLALECFKLFRFTSYARVDFRVDKNGNPWILEINANPCISPDSGFMAAAREGHLTDLDVARRIITKDRKEFDTLYGN